MGTVTGLSLAGLPLLVILIIWWLPLLHIAFSSRTRGGEKVAWILLVVFVSWFAWIFFLLLAPLKSPRDYR